MRSRLARPKENLYKTSLQTKLRTYDSESPADDFSRDQSDRMEEFDNMATITSKSMLSKLNPFKRKQQPQSVCERPPLRKRHSLAPGTEMDPQQYLRNTMSGRASLSGLSSSRNFIHRPSLFQQPSSTVEEEQDVLENTTIADLIRAIEMAHTENVVSSDAFGNDDDEVGSNGRGRNVGNNPFTPPHHQSLLTINGRPPYSRSHTIHGPSSDIMPMKVSKGPKRLNSIVSASPNENDRGGILGEMSPFTRRLSFRPPPPYTSSPSPTPSNDFTSSSQQSIKPALKRRFSVRASNLEQAPGQFHKGSSQNIHVTAPSSHQQQSSSSAPTNPFTRRLSWRPTPSTLAQPKDKDKKESKK